MSAGTVFGKVVLDKPSKCHCGPDDPVTGHVALTYYPRGARSSAGSNDLQSLFGPLKIFVDFTGRAKTKIHKSNGNSSSTYRGRAPLFAQHHKIYDGTYNSKAGECVRFPFSFNFPERTQHMPGQGDFRQDARFHEEAGGPLPPTFSTKNMGFSRSFVAFVEYRIGASFRMPGIDIEVRGVDFEESRPDVLYEQPSPPISQISRSKTQQYGHTVTLQNEHLLPEDQRPSGFREKAKFKFSSQQYPTYVFDIISTVPSEIHIGQPLAIELSVHPNINRCTAPLPPEIKLSSLHACLTSRIEIRAEYGFLSSQEAHKNNHLPWFVTEIVDKDVPFCKANDHTKIIRSRDPLLGVQSSFSTYNICQRYTLEVEFTIAAAEKYTKLKRVVPITVLGPVDDGSTQGAYAPAYGGYAEASSSAIATSSRRSAELSAPPAPSNPETALPEYERPPEYDRVLETTTENDTPQSNGMDKGKGALV
ncbi:hypothetical protein E2P81_ATG10200 [Venturia nashicola]|nr:hypothetical protein E2P81_ATG10200 [Venturia nashicola]